MTTEQQTPKAARRSLLASLVSTHTAIRYGRAAAMDVQKRTGQPRSAKVVQDNFEAKELPTCPASHPARNPYPPWLSGSLSMLVKVLARKGRRQHHALALVQLVTISRERRTFPRVRSRLTLVRAEGEEATIAVLHDKFARVPGRVAKGSRELDSAREILGV